MAQKEEFNTLNEHANGSIGCALEWNRTSIRNSNTQQQFVLMHYTEFDHFVLHRYFDYYY